jgi:hypothetical protein
MSIVFGLFSALLALVTMRILGTADLDPVAYFGGIALAGLVGVGTAMVLARAQSIARLRGLSWLLVPLAGGVVGMAVQTIIYARSPFERPILLAVGLSTFEPDRWILCGLPMGAIPALVATAVLGLAMRVAGPNGSADARERMTVPFAGACALFAAPALALVRVAELPAVVVMMVLAMGALFQVLASDRSRAAWLHRIFAGEDETFEVVSLETCPTALDLPAAVGTVFPRAAIVKLAGDTTYRGSARTAHASTGDTVIEATQPLRHRRLVVLTLVATSTIGTAIAIVARVASTT